MRAAVYRSVDDLRVEEVPGPRIDAGGIFVRAAACTAGAEPGLARPAVSGHNGSMQQIKIFKALEHETQKLEDSVNQWIAQSGVRVLQISGKIAPQTELPDGADAPMRKHLYPCSDLLVVLLYETPTA